VGPYRRGEFGWVWVSSHRVGAQWRHGVRTGGVLGRVMGIQHRWRCHGRVGDTLGGVAVSSCLSGMIGVEGTRMDASGAVSGTGTHLDA